MKNIFPYSLSFSSFLSFFFHRLQWIFPWRFLTARSAHFQATLNQYRRNCHICMNLTIWLLKNWVYIISMCHSISLTKIIDISLPPTRRCHFGNVLGRLSYETVQKTPLILRYYNNSQLRKLIHMGTHVFEHKIFFMYRCIDHHSTTFQDFLLW